MWTSVKIQIPRAAGIDAVRKANTHKGEEQTAESMAVQTIKHASDPHHNNIKKRQVKEASVAII